MDMLFTDGMLEPKLEDGSECGERGLVRMFYELVENPTESTKQNGRARGQTRAPAESVIRWGAGTFGNRHRNRKRAPTHPRGRADGTLDTKTGAEIMELFLNLNGQGQTIFMVTHNHDNAQLAHGPCRRSLASFYNRLVRAGGQ